MKKRLASLILLLSAPAFADDAADTSTARALGVEGVTLADAGKCKEAIEKLDRAEKLHHAPTTATRLGECEIETGKIVRGTERLQRVVRERQPANAPPAFLAAAARAEKALTTALPRIATLRISVSPAPGSDVALVIDDEPAPLAILDTDRHIDPGAHAITVRAPGFFPVTRSASVAEGETRSLVIELQRDPNASVVESTPHATQPESSPSKVPAILAFGLGAVGLGVGVYAATVADEKTTLLENQCNAQHICPAGLRSTYDDAKTWSTVSTAGFIGAGVGVTSGVVLLLLAGSSSKKPSVRPVVGATSVGLDGVF